MRARTLAWLLAGCAPAAPPPPLDSPPPPPPAKPAVPARWVFRGSPPRAEAELRLPTGEVLQVGEQGRRWSVDRAYAVAHADTLAPVDLVDVRREGEGLLFLGRDGSLHGARGPLERMEPHRGRPLESARFALGERAILGITPDGVWLRAADANAEWTRAPFGLRRGERVVGLASDRRGRVAVLLWPQRLLVSTDDGVTFRRVALVGIGASRVTRDAAGDLWLQGSRADGADATTFAKLSANGATLSAGGKPAPLMPAAVEETKWFLAGDTQVLVSTTYAGGAGGASGGAERRELQTHVAMGRVGGALERPLPLPPGAIDRVEVVGHEGRVVVATVRGQDVELFEVMQGGAKLEPLGAFSREEFDFSDVLLAAGPSGFVVTRRLCDARGADAQGRPSRCAARVRVGGAWRSLPADVDPAAPAVAVDRALLWDRGGKELVEIPFSTGALSRTGVALSQVVALSAGPAGARAAIVNAPPRFIRIQGSTVVSEEALPVFLTTGSFVGERGVVGSPEGFFETPDGGAHWLAIDVAGHQTPRCAPAGCSFGEALRLGWDYPARKVFHGFDRPSTHLLAPTPRPPPPPTPVDLDCSAGAKWSPLPKELGGMDRRWKLGLAGDARWMNVVREGNDPTKTRVLALRGGGAPDTRALGLERAAGRPHQRLADAGLLRAFFSFGAKSPTSAYAPVDATFGWVDAATGRVGKGTLRGLPPFRVGEGSLDALLAVVDGGVFLLPNAPGAAPRLVQLEGRVEVFGAPPPASRPYDQVVRAGSVIVLASGGRELELAMTSDRGKTWKTETLSLGEPSWLSVVGGAPVVVVSGGGDPTAVLPLGGMDGDVPDWRPVERPEALEPCNPRSSTGAAWEYLTTGEVRLNLQSPRASVLASQMRFTRYETPTRRCTAVVLAYEPGGAGEDWHALVAPHDLGHGHLTRKGAKGLEWTTLACKRR